MFSKDKLICDQIGKGVDHGNKSLYSKDIVRATHEGSTLVKKINIYDIRDKCKDLSKAISQQQGVYGFLPINDLSPLPTDISLGPKKILTWQEFDPIKLHKQVFASGKYNCCGERIQLPTRINIDRFEQLAYGYWDHHLPTLLRYGFPLDFPDDARQFLKSTEENHKSAVEFERDIENYIKTEREYSAIFGPFDHPFLATRLKSVLFCLDLNQTVITEE